MVIWNHPSVKSIENFHLWIEYYFWAFMLDEWEVHSYVIVHSRLLFPRQWNFVSMVCICFGIIRYSYEIFQIDCLKKWSFCGSLQYGNNKCLDSWNCVNWSFGLHAIVLVLVYVMCRLNLRNAHRFIIIDNNINYYHY